jgi:hypothetical protein
LKKAARPIHPSELEQGNHRLIDFWDPQTGRAYEWAFRHGGKEIEINSNAQLLLSDVATLHAVCVLVMALHNFWNLGENR